MRTSKEMFTLFEKIAVSDERIRVMTLEGSRVNPNVTPNVYQDYDITFLVTDVASFTCSDEWLAIFGDLLFMQKPETMALFPPGIPAGWFSYLMLFSDGIKIDLTLIPLTDIEEYFKQDPLIRILLDKDSICPGSPSPSDEQFWVQKPDAAFVSDCANEFSMTSTYVAKGLLRNELLSANWIFDQILRAELLRMLGYLTGSRRGFPVNTGKYDKRLPGFLHDSERKKLFTTYDLQNTEAVWKALSAAIGLFEDSMAEVCATLGFEYPDYVRKAKIYIEILKSIK